MSALIQFFRDPPRNVPMIIGTSVATTLAVVTLAKLALQSPPKPKLILSPRDTLLPALTKDEQDLLYYPPDIFPGARDVTSTVSPVTWGPQAQVADCTSTAPFESMNGVPKTGGRCFCSTVSVLHVSHLANSPTPSSSSAVGSYSLIYSGGATVTVLPTYLSTLDFTARRF